MENKEQIERIQHYEALLDRVEQAHGVLARALEAFEKTEPLCAELDEYLAGEDWKQDFMDDEEGKLPADLKRGVLSEDGIYFALEEHRQLLAELLHVVARALEG